MSGCEEKIGTTPFKRANWVACLHLQGEINPQQQTQRFAGVLGGMEENRVNDLTCLSDSVQGDAAIGDVDCLIHQSTVT